MKHGMQAELPKLFLNYKQIVPAVWYHIKQVYAEMRHPYFLFCWNDNFMR